MDPVWGPNKALNRINNNNTRPLFETKDPEKTILHGIDGVVHAGEMLLVLRRPGSGCSTLKNLAGFSEDYIRVEGDIKYNSVDINIIKHRFRADVVYNAEGLLHWIIFWVIPLTSHSGGTLSASYSRPDIKICG